MKKGRKEGSSHHLNVASVKLCMDGEEKGARAKGVER